jgi:O-methyltransferase involved in polyketide biosynthesis
VAPKCSLERIRIDLDNVDARRGLFSRLSRNASNVLVISEGLLIYLMPDQVGALAQDLAASPAFRRWIVDIVSPGLLKMASERMGAIVRKAGAPYLFGPPEGPPFFERYGWQPMKVRSLLKAANRLKRLPPFLRLMALFPESTGAQGSRPWSAVCLLEKSV